MLFKSYHRGFNQQLREPFEKMIYMEKLAIPLDGNLDLESLKTVTKPAKGAQTSAAKNKVAINFSRIQPSSTTNDATKRSTVNLPKIESGNRHHNSTDLTLGIKEKGLNSYLNRKFDFVVPQHKMSKPDEKYSSHRLEGGILNLNDTMETNHENISHLPSNDVKAPYPFNLDETHIKNDHNNSHNGNETGSPKMGSSSPKDVQTLDKVFDSIAFDNLKLPSVPALRR